MNINDLLFERAQKTIPGGVNSPVRAFRSVGRSPVFIDHAQGAWLWDKNGKRYIDYIGSWGPMILGHNHPAVIEAVQQAINKGLSFGAVTEREVEIAEEIVKIMPNIEQVRLVSSGTEAGMSAIRLARGYTGRNTVVKFEGCYHGHSDSLLVKAGSGMLTFGNPSSAGVPSDTTKHTLVLEYNNVEMLQEAFQNHGNEIACVIVELVAGNMNMIPATQAFVDTIRTLCTKYGALMIADEVMTGFRVALKGAQSLYNVVPDITMLGKVIGGGMPVAAFGGRKDVMSKISPLGAVYQAGTLSGNPVAVTCGLATLKEIQKEHFYENLSKHTEALTNGLVAVAKELGIAFTARSLGGMMGFFLTETLPDSFADMARLDPSVFARFFNAMLERGVYLAPSIYEAGFVSAAHDDAIIDQTLQAARESFKLL